MSNLVVFDGDTVLDVDRVIYCVPVWDGNAMRTEVGFENGKGGIDTQLITKRAGREFAAWVASRLVDAAEDRQRGAGEGEVSDGDDN